MGVGRETGGSFAGPMRAGSGVKPVANFEAAAPCVRRWEAMEGISQTRGRFH